MQGLAPGIRMRTESHTMIKQLSVFLENRSSRLEKLAEIFVDNQISIVSVSFSDSTEYGLIRMIVSDPERAAQVLKENGFAVTINTVLAVGLPKRKGALGDMMKLLSACEIEYIYTLSAKHENAYMVVKVADVYSAMAILENKNYVLADEDLAYSMN